MDPRDITVPLQEVKNTAVDALTVAAVLVGAWLLYSFTRQGRRRY